MTYVRRRPRRRVLARPDYRARAVAAIVGAIAAATVCLFVIGLVTLT